MSTIQWVPLPLIFVVPVIITPTVYHMVMFTAYNIENICYGHYAVLCLLQSDRTIVQSWELFWCVLYVAMATNSILPILRLLTF